MKKVINLFIVVLLTNLGYSQQLVQNIGELYRLKENETLFINKPLKDLLKEIDPEIKTVVSFSEESYSLFLFNFTSLDQQIKDEDNSPTLFVQMKELVPWRWEDRPKGTELNWTVNDNQKYGDFIIRRIEIILDSHD